MLNLLLPNDDLREEVYDYLPLLLAEYQGCLEALFITQVRAVQELIWAEGLVPKCTGGGGAVGEEERRGAIWMKGGMSDSWTIDSKLNPCAL